MATLPSQGSRDFDFSSGSQGSVIDTRVPTVQANAPGQSTPAINQTLLTPADRLEALRIERFRTAQETQSKETGEFFAPGTRSILGTNESLATRLEGFLHGTEKDTLQHSIDNPIFETTKEQQTERFGGPVGSSEYYKWKSEHPFLTYLPKQLTEPFGLQYPDEETWDKMSRVDQASFTSKSASFAMAKLITTFPKNLIKVPYEAVMRDAADITLLWKTAADGKFSMEELREREKNNFTGVPFIGKVDSHFKSYDDCIASGLGANTCRATTGAQVFADVVIPVAIYEAFVGTMRPTYKLDPKGGKLEIRAKDQATIKELAVEERGRIRLKQNQQKNADYYPMSKEQVKTYKGNQKNTFFKITDNHNGSFTWSIVQAKNKFSNTVGNYVRGKLGMKQRLKQGGFGKEVELDNVVIYPNRQSLPQTPKPQPAQTGAVAKGELAVVPVESVSSQLAKGIKGDPAKPTPKVQGIMDSIKKGDDIPPVPVFKDGDKFILNKDGDNRLAAYIALGETNIPVRIEQETNLSSAEKQDFELKRAGDEASQAPDKFDNTLNYINEIKQDPNYKITLGSVGGDENRALARILQQRLDVDNVPQEIQDIIFANTPQVKDVETGELLNAESGVRGEHINQLLNTLERDLRTPFKDGDLTPGQVAPQANQTPVPTQSKPKIKPFPKKPLPGRENAMASPDEITNLGVAGAAKGFPLELTDSIINAMTGKNTAGELTHAEYVSVINVISGYKSNPGLEASFIPTTLKSLSPRHRWFPEYEYQTGVPIYSDGYVRMENVFQNIKNEKIGYVTMANEIFTIKDAKGNIIRDYTKTGKANEQRLITAYLRGNTKAVTENASLTAEVKADIIEIAGRLEAGYKEIGPLLGVPVDIFKDNYSPGIADLGGVFQQYKEGSGFPSEIPFFAKFKQHGSFAPQLDNSLELFYIYTNAGLRSKYLNPALADMKTLHDNIPNDKVRNSFKNYVHEKLNYSGEWERAIDDIVKKQNAQLGLQLPEDVARQLTNVLMSNVYASGVGTPKAVFRNFLQTPTLTYSRLGPWQYAAAVKNVLNDPSVLKRIEEEGHLLNIGIEHGEELSRSGVTLGGLLNADKKLADTVLRPFSYADTLNRAITAEQINLKWNNAVIKLQKGEITVDQFEFGEQYLDFGMLNPLDRNIIRDHIAAGNLADAKNHLTRLTIDETQWPYRRGTGPEAFDGLKGKAIGTFLTWPVEYAHTIGRYIKLKQYNKLVRLIAASTTMKRSIEETFGWDFTKAFFLGPVRGGVISPVAQEAIDVANYTSAALQGNAQQMEESKQEILNSMKLLYPGGLFADKQASFWKSVNEGPNEEGLYPIYSQSGKLKYFGDFAELISISGGFPTTKQEQESSFIKDIQEHKIDRSRAKDDIMELYREEKFEEADRMAEIFEIRISPQDFEKYHVPLSSRLYKHLDRSGKGKFEAQFEQLQGGE